MKGSEYVICFEKPLNFDVCSVYAAGSGNSFRDFCDCDSVYRIAAVTSGSGKLVAQNSSTDIKENDIFILFPHEKASFEGVFEYNAVCFSLNPGKYSEGFGIIKANTTAEQRIINDSNVYSALKNLAKELAAGDNSFSEELVSLFCGLLLVYVLRAFDTAGGEKDVEEINFKVCSKVMSYIDTNVLSMKNLREVSRVMGYNYSYISTLFHRTTGITLNGYFKNKRMNEAKRLLLNSKISISEIARLMNYSSVYAFSKAFKEYFGSSPGHFSGRFSK